jgi:HD-GYP domain-containing protein (c-di-GMP phosphodiesterase class II)
MTHQDDLAFLNGDSSLKDKLVSAHQRIQESLPFIARIAVALYDPATRMLKTYVHSSGEDDPLSRYQASIDDAPSLHAILEAGHPRVINNMVTFDNGSQEHTRRIGRQGYAASYTLPMFNHGNLVGFLFFNSYQQDAFDDDALRQLDLYGHLIALMVLNELSTARTLAAAVKTAGHITHTRDPETGSHLDRMSRYARLIASNLAAEFDLDDYYIEHVFMFAPLHDIGKIGIPDNILLKPGSLSDEEWEIMRTHVTKGREMIDDLLDNFGLNGLDHVDVLRNIAHFHHEAVNGTGYPEGRHGSEIPLEARIVAVADVFDALTSVRPYKAAWSNEKAFEMLEKLSGETLDSACVAALRSEQEAVIQIQQQFREDPLG